MANYYNTTGSFGSTGIKTTTCGFQPIGIRVTISSKGGETYTHFSQGQADNSGYTTCHAFIQDTTGGKTVKFAGNNGQIASVWERVSGTLTEVFAATFDSFTATAGKINVTTANSNYQCNIELWD